MRRSAQIPVLVLILVFISTATANSQKAASSHYTGYMTYDSGVIYVDGGTGRYMAVDLASRTVIWTLNQPSIRTFVAPAFSNGLIFILGTKDDSSELFALDRTSGGQHWRRPFLRAAYNPSPTTCLDKLLLNDAVNGVEYFLDASTGDDAWDTKGRPYHFFHPPAISDSRAWFVSKKPGADRTYGILAVGCVKGEIVQAIEAPAFSISRRPILLHRNHALLAVDRVERTPASITMVDLATGGKNWSVVTPFDIGLSPVIEDDILIGGTGGVWGIDLSSGTLLFQYKARSGSASTFCVVKNAIVYQDGPQTLRAVEKTTNKFLWDSRLPSSVSSNLVACGDFVCVKIGGDKLAVVDSQTGKTTVPVSLKENEARALTASP
jgi:outer membrane protein assembly factor BamB